MSHTLESPMSEMKPPPFLSGAALLFWGWQTGFLVPGIVMAVVLESRRFVDARWEFADQDISRIWTFCSVLFLAAIVYAFAANDGVNSFAGLVGDLSLSAQRRAGDTSSQTAVSMMRWLPMVLFLFVVAQAFNTRTAVPLATISLIFRRRLARARARGEPPATMTTGHVLTAYFVICMSASTTTTEITKSATFFAGFGALLAWSIWPYRARRFGLPIWAAVLAFVLIAGYGGQRGLVAVQQLINRYNPQWFARFSQRGFDPETGWTELGHVGRMKTSGRIVIRVRTHGGSPPGLLREAAYRDYGPRAWRAGNAAGEFEYVAPQGDGTTWQLEPDATDPPGVQIACSVPRRKALLPLPHHSSRLENLPDYSILTANRNGAVLIEGTGFVLFDASYGSGRALDSPPDESDRQIPERELPAIRQVRAELELAGRSREAKLNAVSRFFASKFGYSLYQDRPEPGDQNTALARFLLETRSGHCEYFATATVLLLRELGLPARYAVGYAVHEGSEGHYVVRQRDAHAWCLVWDPEHEVWEEFDTTPGTWIDAERQRASMFEWLSDLWSAIKFEIAKVRWGETNVRRYVLWALIPVLGFLLYQIVFRRRRLRRGTRRVNPAEAMSRAGLDSEFYRLESRLQEWGYEREPGETAARWLTRIGKGAGLAEFQPALWEVLQGHNRLRFDPEGLPVEAREAMRREVDQCLARMEEWRRAA